MLTAFASRDALMQVAAERIAKALQDGVNARGAACAALSGGATPEPAYQLLAAIPLDWPKITFAQVDERFVPPSYPGSNENMLRRALAPALNAGARLVPMYSDAATPKDAADDADARYAGLAFDVALMGMGEDGHTASWFPGAMGLAEALNSDRTVVALHTPGAAASAHRLSLTRAAVARAGSVILLITGQSKRERLESALQNPKDAPPVAALFGRPTRQPEVLWTP